jgi:hypothetical protein
VHGCFLVSHLAVPLKVAVGRDCGKKSPRSYGSATASRTGVPTHVQPLWLEYPHRRRSTRNARASRALIDSGANVHVVSVAGAKLLLQQKQIDTAFLAASLDHDTRELSEDLSSLGIAQIFITPERPAPLDAAIARGVNLNRLRRKLRTPALT